MAVARRVDQRFAQRHIPPALAVNDRPAVRGRPYARSEVVRRREPGRVQFRVPAGQVNRIGAWIRAFVGEGGEEVDIRASRAPAGQQMGIDEGEGGVARDCDARP